MKCPKCSYLGFETGDRCKNCGYDFSLITKHTGETIEFDVDIRSHEVEPPIPGLPFFSPAYDSESDEPLIKVPATPRPPLAVRRAPDTPRLRAVTRSPRFVESEPVLKFEEEVAPAPPPAIRAPRVERSTADLMVSSSKARMTAAAIDHAILGAIDVGVVYFTLRMAGLSMSEWATLPALPLVAFLLLVKLSYFCAFTAVGGQTIGKMAARIRVVSADDEPLDAALALRRTLAGGATAGLLGLGFLPALFTSDGRPLHDRLARTRVVALPSA